MRRRKAAARTDSSSHLARGVRAVDRMEVNVLVRKLLCDAKKSASRELSNRSTQWGEYPRRVCSETSRPFASPRADGTRPILGFRRPGVVGAGLAGQQPDRMERGPRRPIEAMGPEGGSEDPCQRG